MTPNEENLKVEENEKNVTSEAIVEDESKGEEESAPTMKDITSMIDSIDNITRSMEINKQIINASENLEDVCDRLGIFGDDREFLKKKLTENIITEEEFKSIIFDKDRLDKEFFTREDGSVISFEKKILLVMSTTEYELKVELIKYLKLFYDMEMDAQKSMDEITASIRDFKDGEVTELSSAIANTFKQSLNDRFAELDKIENELERKKREKMLTRMKSAYTFDEEIAVLERYPSIVKSMLGEINKPDKIKDIGIKYGIKRKQKDCFSTLFSIINDDSSKSLERQYMAPDNYVAGYENFFGLFLVRFFSKEDWSSPNAFTKEMHNATIVILNSLMAGTLNKEFRDELIGNINKVWAIFKKYM